MNQAVDNGLQVQNLWCGNFAPTVLRTHQLKIPQKKIFLAPALDS